MLRFYAERFLNIHDRLDAFIRAFPKDALSDSPISGDLVAIGAQILNLKENLAYIRQNCEDMGLESAIDQLDYINNLFKGTPGTKEEMRTALEGLQRCICQGLSKHIFIQIPRDKARYYEQQALLGESVSRKFKTVREELQEAGSCYATGRYTATVFHLMRVMEVGVQRLGKKLGVANPREQEWQKILNDLNGILKQMRNPPAKMTAKQKAKIEQYSQAVALLANVKDAWRNRVVHTKASYDDREAERVLKAVEAYMQYLATIL
jgi:hypothetical protein